MVFGFTKRELWHKIKELDSSVSLNKDYSLFRQVANRAVDNILDIQRDNIRPEARSVLESFVDVFCKHVKRYWNEKGSQKFDAMYNRHTDFFEIQHNFEQILHPPPPPLPPIDSPPVIDNSGEPQQKKGRAQTYKDAKVIRESYPEGLVSYLKDS